MSKKSRKRNKKILAAIGIGLGAAALASKKRNTSIQANEAKEAGFAASNKKASIADVSGPVKKKSVDTGTGRDFGESSPKYEPKKTRIRPFRSLDLGVPEGSKPLKLQDNSIRAKNRQTSSAGIKEPNKPMVASIFPKSQTADNYRADMQDFGRTNQYKSGGRVKGCGKALRGFGKAMKGKR